MSDKVNVAHANDHMTKGQRILLPDPSVASRNPSDSPNENGVK